MPFVGPHPPTPASVGDRVIPVERIMLGLVFTLAAALAVAACYIGVVGA